MYWDISFARGVRIVMLKGHVTKCSYADRSEELGVSYTLGIEIVCNKNLVPAVSLAVVFDWPFDLIRTELPPLRRVPDLLKVPDVVLVLALGKVFPRYEVSADVMARKQ